MLHLYTCVYVCECIWFHICYSTIHNKENHCDKVWINLVENRRAYWRILNENVVPNTCMVAICNDTVSTICKLKEICYNQ